MSMDKGKVVVKHGGGGAVYGLGFFGALFYFVQAADGFWGVIFGIIKAFFWPAILIYDLLKSLAA